MTGHESGKSEGGDSEWKNMMPEKSTVCRPETGTGKKRTPVFPVLHVSSYPLRPAAATVDSRIAMQIRLECEEQKKSGGD